MFTANKLCGVGLIAASLVAGGWSHADAQPMREMTPKEAERKARKIAKGYDKALRDEQKDLDKDVRKAFKPSPPPGKGWRKEELRVDAIRPADIGLTFLNRDEGIIVAQLDPRGPMARYGFREGDRIVEVDGREIGREKEFFQYLFAEDVRWGRVGITVWRDRREVEIVVSPMKLIDATPVRKDPLTELGMELGDRAGNDLRVVDVLPQSAAEVAGIRRGDEIYAFDNVEVRSAKHLRQLIAELGTGSYYIHVERDASSRKLAIDVPE